MKMGFSLLKMTVFPFSRSTPISQYCFQSWSRHQMIRWVTSASGSCISSMTSPDASITQMLCQLEGNNSQATSSEYISLCNSMITKCAKNGRIVDARHLFDKMSRRNVVSWNALLSGYAHDGRIGEARQIFEEMPERNVVSWNSIISSYAMMGKFEEARELFDKAPERNIVSWTAMISGYAKHGKVDIAHQLFEKMPERDIVSWNTMITAYTSIGRVDDAKLLFDKMPDRDVISWNLMITSYAKYGKIKDAYELFGKMPEPDVVSWNALISGYIRNGRMEEACQLFEKMPKRNVVSWTAMIAGYSQNGKLENAYRLFDKMPKRNVVSWNAMIAGYAQNGRIEDARKMFDRMPEKNATSWNTLIAWYVQNGQVEVACQLFDSMPVRNLLSYTMMIQGYAQDGKLQDARRVFDQMPERDVVAWTAMVAGYCYNGRMKDAHQLFDKIPERDVICWNAIIAGYLQNGYGEEAVRLFSQMQLINVKPTQATFTSVVSACASLAALEQGKQVHQQIIKTGFGNDVLLGNALITMYARCGSIDDGRQIFGTMSEHTVVSWNSLITGCSQHGYGKEAIQLFDQMLAAGIKPDHISFVGVLSACSHDGLLAQGWHYFHSMGQDHCITPQPEHYACMVDLLGRSGQLVEARAFIDKIPFEPDAAVLGVLLGACRIHVNIDLGKCIAEQLIELEPQNASTYVLLSNMYAMAGRWDDVKSVRMRMKDKGVVKSPGCSWIEAKNKVHTFLVGDRSHPQTDKIYSMLSRLHLEMEEIGYAPDLNFVLHDVEEEQKKEILGHHSEKLAIAFGLINTFTGTPIRVIKNLRVCGDCHTASKYISKIANREIILRDAARFHHFKDGLCSCRDYWWHGGYKRTQQENSIRLAELEEKIHNIERKLAILARRSTNISFSPDEDSD